MCIQAARTPATIHAVNAQTRHVLISLTLPPFQFSTYAGGAAKNIHESLSQREKIVNELAPRRWITHPRNRRVPRVQSTHKFLLRISSLNERATFNLALNELDNYPAADLPWNRASAVPYSCEGKEFTNALPGDRRCWIYRFEHR
jgi:hypothetical protein